MPPKSIRKPLSIEEHRELAKDLFAMRTHLARLIIDLDRYTGSRRSTALAARAVAAIDNLRASQDAQLRKDHPEDFEATIYYPQR